MFFRFYEPHSLRHGSPSQTIHCRELYNACVNIQRLRVLAYVFGRSENYPSRICKIRYQGLSLNLPADDSPSLIITRGSNGISNLFPEQKTSASGEGMLCFISTGVTMNKTSKRRKRYNYSYNTLASL